MSTAHLQNDNAVDVVLERIVEITSTYCTGRECSPASTLELPHCVQKFPCWILCSDERLRFCQQADHTKRADQVCLPDLARGGESVATPRLSKHRQGSHACLADPAAICRAPISRDGSRLSTRRLLGRKLYLFRSRRRPPST